MSASTSSSSPSSLSSEGIVPSPEVSHPSQSKFITSDGDHGGSTGDPGADGEGGGSGTERSRGPWNHKAQSLATFATSSMTIAHSDRPSACIGGGDPGGEGGGCCSTRRCCRSVAERLLALGGSSS